MEKTPRKLPYPGILAVAVSIYILYTAFGNVYALKQIPSPLYGGDLYNGLGGVIHILDGGNPLDSAQMVGQVPWVPWFYHLSVAVFSKLIGLDAARGMIDFSLPIDIAMLIVFYLLVANLNENKAQTGYFFAIIALLQSYVILKYSAFSSHLMVPAFALALLLFIKRPSWKSAALSGVLLGLASLSNTQAFFASFMLLGFVALFFLFPRIVDVEKRKIAFSSEAKELLKLYAAIFAIGLLIAMLFWYRPIFVYRGNTPNDIQNITWLDMKNPIYLFGSIEDIFLGLFSPFQSTLVQSAVAVLAIIGLAHTLKHRKKVECLFILALLSAWILGAIHPVITEPLFNQQLMNAFVSSQLQIALSAALILMGMLAIHEFLSRRGALAANAFIFAMLLIALVYYSDSWNAWEADQWTRVGMSELQAPYLELAGWIRTNTGVNDVVLTTNEDGFMMNALTGRKVVSYRRAHSSPYINVSERMADQAVMVYGTNDTERALLLKKYGVKYILWTNRWVQNEFSFDSSGRLNGFFDPLTAPDESNYRAYWDSEGVKYLKVTMPMDPAPREGEPTYAQLIALPYQMSLEPVNPSLYDNFELKKTISWDGVEMFRVYGIKADAG